MSANVSSKINALRTRIGREIAKESKTKSDDLSWLCRKAEIAFVLPRVIWNVLISIPDKEEPPPKKTTLKAQICRIDDATTP